MIAERLASIAQAGAADWTTVMAYLAAAVLSCRAARREQPSGHAAGDVSFWRATAAVLLILAINELLDLQTVLTTLGRKHAHATGWYGERRKVQYAFVIALGAVLVLGSVLAAWRARHRPASVRLALAGLGLIGLFIVLRAASFHHVDAILASGTPAFNLGSLQEATGIAIVAAAASFYRPSP